MKKLSTWLQSLANERMMSVQDYARGLGIPESTARHHLRGRVPLDNGTWERIARFLGMPFQTVRTNFLLQLEDEGRISECVVCKDEIIVWKANVLCRKLECKREYDRTRKANKRKQLSDNKIKTNNTLNTSNFKNAKHLTHNEINREYVNNATISFLENGGVIEKLNPTIAEGLDYFTSETVKPSFSSLGNDLT